MVKPRVLVIGNTTLEIFFEINSLPMSGDTVRASAFTEDVGGRGAMSCFSFDALGVCPILLGRIGEDFNAMRIKRRLSRSGADLRFLSTARGIKTAVNMTLCDSICKRGVEFPGAVSRITKRDVEDAFTSCPDAVYLNFDVNPEIADCATVFAANRNVPVFLGAFPVKKNIDMAELLNIDTVFLNEEDVKAYTGVSASTIEGCMKASVMLRNIMHLKCVVIKRGIKGTFISTGKYYRAVQAFNLTVTDAGHEKYADIAFDTAFISHILKHGTYNGSCEFANVFSALTASRSEDESLFPDTEEIERFAKVNEVSFDIGDEDG